MIFPFLKVFDTHFHIFDPRFPLTINHGFLPEFFRIKDYKEKTKEFNLCGGALVSTSFQDNQQEFLLQALQDLGPSFVGILQLDEIKTDAEILKLNQLGIRGLRFNFHRLDNINLQKMEKLAMRIYEIAGWHIELYIESNKLSSLKKVLLSLPAVVIDHIGLSNRGLPHLLSLVEKGVKVKLSGFRRGDIPIKTAIKDLCKADYTNLFFGTDLPSTRCSDPFSIKDLHLLVDTINPDHLDLIFYKNAYQFYRPKLIEQN